MFRLNFAGVYKYLVNDLTEDWENLKEVTGQCVKGKLSCTSGVSRDGNTSFSKNLELWSTGNAMSLPNPPLTKEQQSDAVSLTRLPRHHGLFESMSTTTSGLTKSNESRLACHIYFLHLEFFYLLNLYC